MPSGHLTVLVESFSRAIDQQNANDHQNELIIEIKLPEGCLKTKRSLSSTFHDELCFDLAPSLNDTPDHLNRQATVNVFQHQPSSPSPSLLGMGILELDNLKLDEQHHSYKVPVVDRIGKHAGDVFLIVTHHASSTPAKLRDEMGVEFINEAILNKGPVEGCRERNDMRSSRC